MRIPRASFLLGLTMLNLNPAIEALSMPAIPKVQAWARAYDGAHGPLLDLSQAVPGYPPPPQMLAWLGEAGGSAAMTGYGNIEGESDLRAAYAAHLSQIYGGRVEASETHMTSGCNQAFVATAMTLAGAGETILMTNPRYFNHESTLAMLGIGTAYVDVDPANGFLPDIDAVRAALPGMKAFALVSPNNPTGAVYPAALLDAIFEACREAGVWLIVDETYRDFTDTKHNLLAREGWQETLIQLYSFSKSFCIPGHRLGAVTAGTRVIDGIAKVMDNLQICAPRAVQHAVAQAIEPLTKWRAENRAEIDTRADALRAAMAEVPDWQISALGAYFAYVKHPFEGRGSEAVAQGLAETVGVSCLPGSFFGEGQDRHLRLAFANADAATIRGLAARLKAFQ